MAVTGIGLMSGGLDSMLAACLLMEQGIRVVGITFVTPFFGAERARSAAAQIGFPLLELDITSPHLEVVRNPLSGYGKNMNPCVDCHALMIREAGLTMEREGWDFIFTGEVLNERPFSQTRPSLNRVAKLSGYRGYVLRPLSALHLDETIPEQEGKVDRSRLLDLEGRSRKPQFALAAKYGISDFPAPAGGCLLTDPGYSRRLRELFENGPSDEVRYIDMLRVGRHFRLGPGVKAVVGRNSRENERLAELRNEGDLTLRTPDVPGPTVIVIGAAENTHAEEAARLCARYSDGKPGPVRVTVSGAGREKSLHAAAIEERRLEEIRI